MFVVRYMCIDALRPRQRELLWVIWSKLGCAHGRRILTPSLIDHETKLAQCRQLIARRLPLPRASPFDISRESTGSANVCVVVANDAEVSQTSRQAWGVIAWCDRRWGWGRSAGGPNQLPRWLQRRNCVCSSALLSADAAQQEGIRYSAQLASSGRERKKKRNKTKPTSTHKSTT